MSLLGSIRSRLEQHEGAPSLAAPTPPSRGLPPRAPLASTSSPPQRSAPSFQNASHAGASGTGVFTSLSEDDKAAFFALLDEARLRS